MRIFTPTLLIIALCALAAQINGHASTTCWIPPFTELKFTSQVDAITAANITLKMFRIHPVYTEKFMRLPNYEAVKEQIVERAIGYWSEALQVKNPSGGPLKVARDCIGGQRLIATKQDGTQEEFCATGCQATTKCYGAPIPKKYLDKCQTIQFGQPVVVNNGGPGQPNTDYILLVDASEYTQCEGSTLAFASVCQLDRQTDRPTVGYINFCPNRLHLTYPQVMVTRVTALHELAHAFGFSPTMYAYMRDEHGQPRTPRKKGNGEPALGTYESGVSIPSPNTLSKVERIWKSAKGTYKLNRIVLKTPKVLEVAREHFGCPELDGVEMENQGGTGTAAAHFEKRIVLNEIMAGSVGFDAAVSKLTLAFFYDSGWYAVDWSKAQDYRWAKKAGCDFLFKSCSQYMQERQAAQKSVWPWCSTFDGSDTHCLSYANAYGRCNLARLNQPLPPQYQYFAHIDGEPREAAKFYGGTDELTDYCPYSAPFLGDVSSPSSYCDHPENTIYEGTQVNRQLQGYGPGSRCFDHDSDEGWKAYQCKHVYSFKDVAATCHQYKCSPKGGLIVTLGNKDFTCPVKGGSIRVDTIGPSSFVTGRLICPPCGNVCNRCPLKDTTPPTKPDVRPASLPCPTTKPIKQPLPRPSQSTRHNALKNPNTDKGTHTDFRRHSRQARSVALRPVLFVSRILELFPLRLLKTA